MLKRRRRRKNKLYPSPQETPHTDDDKIVDTRVNANEGSWTPCKNCHPNFVLSNKKKVRLVTRHSSFSQLSLEKNSVFQSFLSKVLKVRVGTKIYIYDVKKTDKSSFCIKLSFETNFKHS